jgi:hypothetical protein
MCVYPLYSCKTLEILYFLEMSLLYFFIQMSGEVGRVKEVV